MRLLKKWITEYNPKITQDYLEYISFRVMVVLKHHRMKIEDPEKYAELLETKKKWNKDHPDKTRISSKKRYEKIKNNPILYQRLKEIQNKYHQKKCEEDPKYREKCNEYQRKRSKRLKAEDPEKYYVMCRIHRQMNKSTGGVKCPRCGFGIKTSTAGRNLGKRPIKCPKCKHSYPKNQCERIRIPRILPEEQKKTEEIKKPSNELVIPEQAFEGLRNLGKAFENEMEEPREISGNERKVAENIKKRMEEYTDKRGINK